MRNPINIMRHELIGLPCTVVSSQNASQKGIKGRIVDETRNTVVIETGIGMKKIQKKGSVFRVVLGKGEVDISGDQIIARPEDRIKKKFAKW